MKPLVPILLLAAGASSRMAPRDKLTETVNGEPLLRRSARVALATGAPVLAVLPPGRPQRAAALSGLAVSPLIARDAGLGMSASLAAGIAALPADSDGVMILPADMPGFTTEDFRRLLDAFAADPTRIVRGASATGTPGHPALFPADLFAPLSRLSGDEGGRSVIRSNAQRVTLIALPDDRAITDLDTPEDWKAFRAAGNPP